MWEQEKVHLELFERLMKGRRVRPTVLMPVWNIAGFALGELSNSYCSTSDQLVSDTYSGAGTALLGKEAAMACTVAVEEVIGEHYNKSVM